MLWFTTLFKNIFNRFNSYFPKSSSFSYLLKLNIFALIWKFNNFGQKFVDKILANIGAHFISIFLFDWLFKPLWWISTTNFFFFSDCRHTICHMYNCNLFKLLRATPEIKAKREIVLQIKLGLITPALTCLCKEITPRKWYYLL